MTILLTNFLRILDIFEGIAIGLVKRDGRISWIYASQMSFQGYIIKKNPFANTFFLFCNNLRELGIFYLYKYSLCLFLHHIPGLCSSRAQWPLAPNFCSWAIRKSYFFHTNHMLGTLDFTVSEHWAPFNFP